MPGIANMKLLKDISANTIQVLLNQVLGVVVFVVISRHLSKNEYGEFNWTLAVMGFIITLLSLRIEQLVVRKVATGENAPHVLTIFTVHVGLMGGLFYLVLFAGSLWFAEFFNRHNLMLALAASQLFGLMSLPFKQVAAGKQHFGWLAVMSLTANAIRALALTVAVLFSNITLQLVIAVYLFSSLAECVVSVYLLAAKTGISITRNWHWPDYTSLLRASLPQIGIVFLNACIARIDWILLGIFSTQVFVAEYSFAYKVFELSPFPLLIIGPILLSRFSAYYSGDTNRSLQQHTATIRLLVRIEMIMATVLPLVLNVVWEPLMDTLTQSKYGASAKTVFFILSLSIPFQYMINLYWTTAFAQNRLMSILRITAVTCSIIVVGDLLLIPLLNTTGAALAYLAAMITEYLLYLYKAGKTASADSRHLITCILIALISGFSVEYLTISVVAKLVLSLGIYTVLVLVCKQLKRGDVKIITTMLKDGETNFQIDAR